MAFVGPDAPTQDPSAATTGGFVGPDSPIDTAPPSPLKKMASVVYAPILKYGGAAMGAALAAPVAATTGPAAPIVEAAAGAGGYAIGGSLADKLDQLIGLSSAPKSVGEIVGKTVSDLREGAQNEVLGRIAGQGVEAGLTSASNATGAVLTKGPDALAKISAMAAKVGVDLTPAELAGTKFLGGIEKIFDNLPWTADVLNDYRLKQIQQLNTKRDAIIASNGNGNDIEQLGLDIKNHADNFVQKLGTVNKDAMIAMKNKLLQKVGSSTTYDDLDISAKQAVQQYQQNLAQRTKAAYTAVSARMPNTTIVPQNTLDAANEILRTQDTLASKNPALIKAAKFFTQSADTTAIPETVKQAYQGAIQSNNVPTKTLLEGEFPGLLNPQTEKSYQEMNDNLHDFNAKKYAQTDDAHGAYQITNDGRQWGNLSDALQKDMGNLVSASDNPELTAAHNIANGLFKQKMALFDDPAFKMINDKYPGAVSSTILKSGNAELINRYKALTGPGLFNKAKDRLTNDVLGISGPDTMIGEDIRKNVRNLGDAATSIYAPQELQHFQNIAKAIDTRAGATTEILNNPYLKKMVSDQATTVPSGIAKALVTPQNSGAAPAIAGLLGDDAKTKVANAFLPHFLSSNQQGDFLPQTFAKEFDTYGRKTVESWYGKSTADDLENLANVGRRMKGLQQSMSVGGIPMKPMMGLYAAESMLHDVTHVATNPNSPAAYMHLAGESAFILGTRQMAKLYATPEGRNLFIQSLTTPQGSKRAGQIAGRIAGILGNETIKSAQGQFSGN